MENTKVDTKVSAEVDTAAEVSAETDTAAAAEVSAETDTAAVEVNAETDAAAAAEAEAPAKAPVTEVLLQYRGYEMNMEDVTNRVKGHYMSKGFTEDSIESMQIYVKPEDFTAYYVINDGVVVGKVNLF